MDTSRAIVCRHYRIVDGPLVGEGGASLVYPGHDLRTGDPVAIKTLRPMYATVPDYRRLLLNEQAVLAAVPHPAFVRYIDGEDDVSNVRLVLEHIPGRTLRENVLADGPVPLEWVSRIVDHLASGLAALHAHGLVHLDVTMRNIILQPDDVPKLIDFGLAQRVGIPQATVLGQTMGTLASIPPERLTGDPVVPASDVYSLAFVVYELLTGRPTFVFPSDEHESENLKNANRFATPVPPSRVCPEANLPTTIDAVLARAMAKRPSDRYPDVRVFASEIAACLEVPRRHRDDETTRISPDSSRWVTVMSAFRMWWTSEPTFDGTMAGTPWLPGIDVDWKRLVHAGRRHLPRVSWPAVSLRTLAITLALVCAIVTGVVFYDDLWPSDVGQDDVQPTYSVTAGIGLILRAGPGLDAEGIDLLDYGTLVTATGPLRHAGGIDWLPVAVEIHGESMEGWVSMDWLVANDDVTAASDGDGPSVLHLVSDVAADVREGVENLLPYDPAMKWGILPLLR